jgi:hypothetical protein
MQRRTRSSAALFAPALMLRVARNAARFSTITWSTPGTGASA